MKALKAFEKEEWPPRQSQVAAPSQQQQQAPNDLKRKQAPTPAAPPESPAVKSSASSSSSSPPPPPPKATLATTTTSAPEATPEKEDSCADTASTTTASTHDTEDEIMTATTATTTTTTTTHPRDEESSDAVVENGEESKPEPETEKSEPVHGTDTNETEIEDDTKPHATEAAPPPPPPPAAERSQSLPILPQLSFASTVVPASNKPLGGDLQCEPQTQEEVHPAIALTLEAFIEILESPNKTPKAIEIVLDAIYLLVAKRYVSGRAGGNEFMMNGSSFSNSETPPSVASHGGDGTPATVIIQEGDGTLEPQPSLLHRVMESVAKCSEQNVDAIQIALVRTTKSILTSPKCGLHESSMLLALRSVFHVFLVTKSQPCKESAKSALQDMLRSVMGRMEAYDAVMRIQDTPETDEQGKPEEADKDDDPADGAASSDSVKAPPFASQYHADAYALFRSLCKMSSKELPAENENETERPTFFNLQAQSDPMSLHGKVLSLELILLALDLSGDAFCNGERFVYLVQNYLCVSLLKNCVSNHTQVAFLSQKIFLVLVRVYDELLAFRWFADARGVAKVWLE